MILHSPFFISSRLLPALKIGNATLSLENISKRDMEGRQSATFILDLPNGQEYLDSSLQSGCQGFYGINGRVQDIFTTYLSFLDAAVESYKYCGSVYTNYPDENMSMFPEYVVEWAAENIDEISMLQYDIEETDKLLIDG